jgi:hypothetical protein
MFSSAAIFSGTSVNASGLWMAGGIGALMMGDDGIDNPLWKRNLPIVEAVAMQGVGGRLICREWIPCVGEQGLQLIEGGQI